MIKIAVFLITLTTIGAGIGYWWSSQPRPDAYKKQISFELKDFEKKAFSTKDHPGTPMVIHFWAAWCAPCLAEIPRLIETAQQYQSKKLLWVTVSGDHSWDDLHVVLPHKTGLTAGIVSLMDSDAQVGEIFGTFQYPETYLLDGTHSVVTKWVGPQDWSDPAVRQKIDQLLRK